MNKRTSGLIQPPPEMVEKITDWVNSSIAHSELVRYNWYLDDYEEHGDDVESRIYRYTDGQINDFKKDIKRCKKILKNSNADYSYLPSDGKVSKIFSVDLMGWKYLEKLEAIPKTKRKKALSGFNKIRVTIDANADASVYRSFGTKYKQIIISAGQLGRDYKKEVVHELRHWTQGLLKNMTQNGNAGKPSRKIKTVDITQNLGKFRFDDTDILIKKLSDSGIDSRDFHALDDIEFYTDIGEDVDDLIEVFKKNRFNRVQRLEALKILTGVKDRKNVEDKKVRKNLWRSRIFVSLKKSRPKWKKAVKLIVSELL